MRGSIRFRELVRRLQTLRTNFLPVSFSPLGQYSSSEYDFARAYVVLAHAEIEAYVEDRARERARQAVGRWKNTGRTSAVISRLLEFHNISMRKPWKRATKSEKEINAAVSSFFDTLKKNHGVKEQDLLTMLYPIGLRLRDMDNAWLATMDSFGLQRGTLAHQSIKTQQPLDPETEYKRIRSEILSGLKKLDRKISRLK